MCGKSEMTQSLSILTGCSAGATESFVVVPFELVKVKWVCFATAPGCSALVITYYPRLQDKTGTFTGPKDVVKDIVRKDGVLGLFAGMEATFWRYPHCISVSPLPNAEM
jgi:solute carrier family 25 (mitochondrial 2-oxodicarboxylate transporter), member 21